MFEGLTTGLLRITAMIFRCLISSFPDGNNYSTALKIIQEVKSKSSQVEAFNSRVQDLIRFKKHFEMFLILLYYRGLKLH